MATEFYDWLLGKVPKTPYAYLTFVCIVAAALWFFGWYELHTRPEVSGIVRNKGFLSGLAVVVLIYVVGTLYCRRHRTESEILRQIGHLVKLIEGPESVQEKVFAVVQLAATAEKEVGRRLVVQLRDKDTPEEVRETIASQLPKFRTSEFDEALIHILQDPEELESLKGYCVTALGKIRDRRALVPLIDVLKNGSKYSGHLRGSAATALHRLGATEAVPTLVEALADDDPDVVGTSITSLGELRDRRAIAPLVDVLKNKSKYSGRLRGAAATALHNLGATEAVPALVEALADDEPDVAGTSITSLGELRDRRAIAPLIEVVKNKSKYSGRLRGAAATALHKLGATEAVPVLIEALADDEPRVVGTSITSLGELRDRRAIAPLIDVLKNKSKYSGHLRGSAATALHMLGASEAVPALIEALEDNEPDVVGTSITSLGELGDRRAIAPLIDVLKNKSKYSGALRGGAATALHMLGAMEAVPTLIDALADDEPDVVGTSITSLGILGAQRALERLTAIARDGAKTTRLRVAAVAALRQIDDDRANEIISDLVSNDNNPPALRRHVAMIRALPDEQFDNPRDEA